MQHAHSSSSVAMYTSSEFMNWCLQLIHEHQHTARTCRSARGLGTRSRTSPEPNSNRVSCQRCRAHTQVQQLSAMQGPGRRASSVSASVRSAWAPGWVQQQIERTVAAAWQSMCVGACRHTYTYSCKLTASPLQHARTHMGTHVESVLK